MVVWKSQQKKCVTLSTSEAKYTAAASAATETVWMRLLLKEIGFEQTEATVIYEDNQGCIAMSKNPEFHSRTKHIDIRTHYIREKIESEELTLQFCNTKNMVADIMTKGLAKDQFEKLRLELGIRETSRSVKLETLIDS